LLSSNNNVWRNLLLLLADSDRLDRGVWQVGPPGSSTAINLADEFGVDQVHILQRGGRYIKTIPTNHTFDLAAAAFASHQNQIIVRPTQLWTIPFQQAVIVHLQNIKTGARELVWIPTAKPQPFDFEMSNWAINHNNLMENPEDFSSPGLLHGDPTLQNEPIITSTESRIDVPSAKAALATVTIRGRDTLMFDQVKQTQAVNHWRHLLTDELWEPKAIPMTSACMVLDAYILYASNDGVLRARPRGNPKSTYHVEQLDSLVPHMSSLYNVVALVHSYDTLEVRHVEKQAEDPFLFAISHRVSNQTGRRQPQAALVRAVCDFPLARWQLATSIVRRSKRCEGADQSSFQSGMDDRFHQERKLEELDRRAQTTARRRAPRVCAFCGRNRSRRLSSDKT
jgi:hypothetical protein